MKYLSVYSFVFELVQNRALWDASKRGDTEQVKILLSKKADANWHPDWVSSILLS